MSIHSKTTQEQIENFHRFVTDQLVQGRSNATLDELFDEWRLANPTPEEFAANVAAIQEAIDGMNRGEKGRDAGDIVRELREKLKHPWAD